MSAVKQKEVTMSSHMQGAKAHTQQRMHGMSRKIAVIMAFAGLIAMPQTAFNGVCSGLRLWAEVVFPALFPALVITSCILSLFKMKKSVSYIYIILTGFLCGFPVGASLCSDYHMNNPEEKVCSTLSAFCNISSPSFVVNYIIFANMKDQFPIPVILLCIYLPVIECILAMLMIYRKDIFEGLKKGDCKNSGENFEKSSGKTAINQESEHFFDILDNAIWKSIKSVLKLGGYIVVFSCIASYLALIPAADYVKGIMCGITEITNGIYLCANLNIMPEARLFIITALNAFGGISTLMQTAGISDSAFFDIKKYTYNKCVLTIVTMLNTAFIMCIL